MDKRLEIIEKRFSELSKEEVKRIKDNIDDVCLDEFNYDQSTGKFCPLAVAINLHETMQNPSDDKVKNELSKRFYPVNVIKGIEGEFYTKARKKDLINVCNKILNDV